VGATARFSIEQDDEPRILPVPPALKLKLKNESLEYTFKRMKPSRRKEILSYLNYLKTESALLRNIDKIVAELKRQGK
jgi:uncharacterized protein YdeI (YjbR/CyaY-like superfamily)